MKYLTLTVPAETIFACVEGNYVIFKLRLLFW